MNFLKFSIRQKITSSFLFLVFIIILVFAFFSYFRASNAMQTEIQGHGKNMIKIFTQMASVHIFENDYVTLLDNANELIRNSDILLITIMDTDGNIWINTNKMRKKSIPMDAFYKTAIHNKKISQRSIYHSNGQKVMEFISPVVALGKVVYLIRTEISLEKIETQAAERIKQIIYIAVGMTLLASFLGVFLSKLLTDPLKKLVKGTGEISQGNLDYKIEVESSDEIGALAKSFNIMTTNLEKERSKRNRAEKKIQVARDELEIRVEQRTMELQEEIEERAAAEEKYRKLMDASPVPIAVYDMEGKTIYVNPSFTRTFGWTLEEVQWKKIDYIPKEEAAKTFKMLEIVKQGESCHGFETRRYNKRKELLDISVSYDVWRGRDNSPKGTVVILHDVTERKRLEMQLVQSGKMEAMGTLAGGIAHDFNNILSGIFAYSQLAQRHLHDTEKVKRHLGQILKGAQRAAGLTQQILTFGRRTEYQKRPLELHLIVREALKLIRSTIPATIEIKENIISAGWVLADDVQIHQVIMNLCTNAYHAMDEHGGIMTVGLTQVKTFGQTLLPNSSLPAGKYIKLEVSDTGHGMDKKTLTQIFDPYFTTKEIGKGTGFGLALVKAIVEEHNGYVQIDSTPGQGSGFYVYFPVEENIPAPLKEEPEIDNFAGGTESIMLVDDEKLLRRGIKEFLEDCGYRVSSFDNGKKAFQEFKKEPERFDLVVTDMTMPEMTGDDLAVEILKIRKDLPIILCTGYSENISKAKALEIGIRKYLLKPILNQELGVLIRELLDEKPK